MGYQIATVALAPVLLMQGRYVRRATPKLSEPSGVRHGIAGSGPPLGLLIVGDSAAAGVGVSTQSEALAGQLVSTLAPDFSVSWKLIAKTGFTTDGLLTHLQSEPQECFDVAVTSLGVNDVTRRTKPSKWVAGQSQLIDLLRSKFQVQHVLVSSVPPMHAFPALPQPLRWYLGNSAKRLNSALRKLAARKTNCAFAQTDFSTSPEFIATDGFHPGAMAYSTWAHRLAALVRQQLEVK